MNHWVKPNEANGLISVLNYYEATLNAHKSFHFRLAHNASIIVEI